MGVLTTARVVFNEEVTPGHRRLILSAPEVGKLARPGQFIAVRCGRGTAPLLRRPLSISDVREGDGLVHLLFRVVGEGTSRLSEVRRGDPVDVMGPLGRGFVLPEGSERTEALLVGGGIGAAPLIFLARCLTQRGVPVRAYLGARTGSDLLGLPELRDLGVEVETATEDGSQGRAGLVTELVGARLAGRESVGHIDGGPSRVVVYACGPLGMLRAIGVLAVSSEASCQVAMEERMACGVGACQGCACALKLGDGLALTRLEPETEHQTSYLRVCRDGPVFRVVAPKEGERQ